jgi:ribosomal protein L21E
LEEWVTERAATDVLIRQHLTRAVQRMKKQAVKKRSERKFSVGDMVYMKLQPYIQSSVMPRANQKLCFKFFGAFQVVEKIGKVAYQLLLP